ncbi:MAG TPA: hypothetical protein VGL02_21370, partial [Streptomyces sp.]
HGALTDTALEHAIARTGAQLEAARANIATAQEKLERLRAAHDGGPGPREAELAQNLDRLRANVARGHDLQAALARQAELRHQHAAAVGEAATADRARDAAGWWQRGTKTRLEETAVAARARAGQLLPEQYRAERDVRELTAQLRAATPGHHQSTVAELIAAQHQALADAEARHPADVANARHFDHAPIDLAERSLAGAHQTHDVRQADLAALHEEQAHRRDQPGDVRGREDLLRRDHDAGQHLDTIDDRAERREQLQRELADHRRHEQYYDHLRHSPGHDHGHGMRM